MEILGIGAPEFIFILIIALIVLGPKDMQKTGRMIGKWLNQLVNSSGWKLFQNTSREIRRLPTTLMREANLEELNEVQKDLNAIDPRKLTQPSASAPTLDSPPPPTADDSAPASSVEPPDDKASAAQEKNA